MRARPDGRRDRQGFVRELDFDQHIVRPQRMRDRKRPAATERVLADHRDRTLARGQAGRSQACLIQRCARPIEREPFAEPAEIKRDRLRCPDARGAWVECDVPPSRTAEPAIRGGIE